MLVITVVNIRDPLKSSGQSRSNSVLAHITVTSGITASGHEEDTVISKIAHDGIEIMAVESFQEILQEVGTYLLVHIITSDLLWDLEGSQKINVGINLWRRCQQTFRFSRADPGKLFFGQSDDHSVLQGLIL